MNHVLVVLTNAVDGREDDYNAWYSDQHLKEVIGLDGFKAAQRFVIDGVQRGSVPYKYMAFYEVEEGQVEIASTALWQANKNHTLLMSDAISPDAAAWWYRPITDVVSS